MAVSSSHVPSGPVSSPLSSTSSLPDTRTTTLPAGAVVRTAKVSGAPREIDAVGRDVLERLGRCGGGKGEQSEAEEGEDDERITATHRPVERSA